MRKIIRRTGKILGIILSVIMVFLIGSTVYHHISLGIETDKIVPNGTMVEVNGHRMHVYAEGEKSGQPTLVFMSGAGTVAPVYDFKSLYTALSEEYHIVVVEKAGYGYSETCDVSRDIDTMLSETREALSLAGESGPFVLFPHSMSGIEAIYWAQQYPQEVAGIIGLDMAVPEYYYSLDASESDFLVQLGQAAVWMGLHRSIPGLSALTETGLTQQEVEQQRYLMYRNALGEDCLLERESVIANAAVVEVGGIPHIPILMFVSNEDTGDNWIPCAKRFAGAAGAQLVTLSCGHYVHNLECNTIAEQSKKFLDTLTY